jgi:hypothetical protein
VIRSGCDGFGVAGLFSAVDVDEEDAGTGRGGWNVCGGLRKVSSSIQNEGARRTRWTHRFESSATQYPFCSCRHVAAIPLEIPHDGPPGNLWEHLLYSFNIYFSGSKAIGDGS